MPHPWLPVDLALPLAVLCWLVLYWMPNSWHCQPSTRTGKGAFGGEGRPLRFPEGLKHGRAEFADAFGKPDGYIPPQIKQSHILAVWPLFWIKKISPPPHPPAPTPAPRSEVKFLQERETRLAGRTCLSGRTCLRWQRTPRGFTEPVPRKHRPFLPEVT